METYKGTKFKTRIIGNELPMNIKLDVLKYWCKVFHDENLAPPYEGGSYGNLSYRLKDTDSFVITSSQSGLSDSTTIDRFVLVDSVDFEKGLVYSKGSRKPSSEAMVHAAIYQQRKDARAIFHGHCKTISSKVKELGISETREEKPYGTIDLVNSVLEILGKNNFVEMKNHGFISIGGSLNDAGNITLSYLNKC